MPWTDDFRTPPAACRPQPLWSWNGDMDEDLIRSMVADFAAKGCGGVFVHPRPGLVSDYLSPRWQQLWGAALEACRAHGMFCQIYDENSYPSGFAGGHVIAREPWRAALFARARRLTDPTTPISEEVLACSDLQGRPLPKDAWKNCSPTSPVMLVTKAAFEAIPWLAGFPMPDLMLPGSGNIFLSTTHEAYAAAHGSAFGSTVTMAFSDEPSLLIPLDGAGWSEELERSFRADHGRELRPLLPLLFLDAPESAVVRHAYHTTCQRLITDNFYRPIHDWCAAHKLSYTGHVNEHHWPMAWGMPSATAALRWFQIPGNDLLGFQFFPDRPDADVVRVARLNLRELDALARQCGRADTLVESCGGGGYWYGPREMRPLEEWLISFGVTVINPHLAHTTLAGARHYDWPQTLTKHSPWWDAYRDHADRIARSVAHLRSGPRARHRTLVISPTTTGWTLAISDKDAHQRLRDGTLELIESLEAGQIDYDLGDELVIAELGRVDGRAFVVGACSYDAVVVPGTMATWLPSTRKLIEAFAAAGGLLLTQGRLPQAVQGVPTPCALPVACDPIVATLRRRLPPYLSAPDGSALPAGLTWRRTEAPDGPLYWICNPWSTPISCSVRLPGSGLMAFSTADGASTPVASTSAGDAQTTRLELPPGASVLWQIRNQPAAVAAPATAQPLPVRVESIIADGNAVPLDQVELSVDGHDIGPADASGIDSTLWQALGVGPSPWNMSIQHRTSFLDRPLPAVPVRLRYRVGVDGGRNLRLGVERPWLWSVTIDGRAIPADAWQPWFDPEFRAAPISLAPGEHVIELATDRPHIHGEVKPIYILGDCAAVPAPVGFRIADPRPLTLGDSGPQGLPTAAGTITCRGTVVLPRAGAVRVALPAWAGSTARVHLGGREAGTITFPHESVVTGPLPAGEIAWEITIAGHLGNLLGPHHADGLPGRWTWERPWGRAKAGSAPADSLCATEVRQTWGAIPPAQPAGAAYRRRPHGLLAPPAITLLA